jgi:pyruvate/2-oxoglutarate dehydrogenase complex dihydrolipoamide acyltransferase (E2) component
MKTNYHEVFVAPLGPNDRSAKITKVAAGSGSFVTREQLLFTLESAKMEIEVHAPTEGWLSHSVREGEIFPTAQPLARLYQAHEDLPVSAAGSEEQAQRPTRKALKLQRSRVHPLELSFTKQTEIQMLESTTGNLYSSSVTVSFNARELEEKIHALIGPGLHVSPADLVTYHLTKLMRTFPQLNGYYSSGAFSYQDINPGLALNLAGKGLKVVALKSADGLSFIDFCVQTQELVARYLRGELTPGDLTDSTFNVSNLFSLGIQEFRPLIAHRHSSVFGIAAPDLAGNFRVTLVFDHRMTDAKECADYFRQVRSEMLG